MFTSFKLNTFKLQYFSGSDKILGIILIFGRRISLIFDLGVKINQNGDLSYLAKQGVLLLNTCLTVRKGMAFFT